MRRRYNDLESVMNLAEKNKHDSEIPQRLIFWDSFQSLNILNIHVAQSLSFSQTSDRYRSVARSSTQVLLLSQTDDLNFSLQKRLSQSLSFSHSNNDTRRLNRISAQALSFNQDATETGEELSVILQGFGSEKVITQGY